MEISHSERLRNVIKYYNSNPHEFALSLGLKGASRLYNIINGRNDMSSKFIKLITDHYPEINSLYLIEGKGPIVKTNIAKTSDRLAAVWEWTKLDLKSFCDKIKYDNDKYLIEIINNRLTPPKNILNLILSAYPEINKDWLIEGTGRMINYDTNNQDSMYKDLYEMTKKTVDLMEDKLKSVLKENELLKNKLQKYENS